MSSGALDKDWRGARLRALNAELDFLVDELADEPKFIGKLDVMLRLAGIEEWPTVPGLLQLDPVYRMTRPQLIRLLMVTTAAGRVK